MSMWLSPSLQCRVHDLVGIQANHNRAMSKTLRSFTMLHDHPNHWGVESLATLSKSPQTLLSFAHPHRTCCQCECDSKLDTSKSPTEMLDFSSKLKTFSRNSPFSAKGVPWSWSSDHGTTGSVDQWPGRQILDLGMLDAPTKIFTEPIQLINVGSVF